MRKTIALTFVALAILMIAMPAVAAEHPQKPGKWQLKMQTEMTGMAVKIPPMTMEVCVTPEDLKDPQKAVPTDAKSDCKVGDYKLDGNTVSWTMSCPKQNLKGSGKITYDGDSYAGTMEMKMGEQEVRTKYSGKWLGACSK